MIINNINYPKQNLNINNQTAIKEKLLMVSSCSAISINELPSSKLKGAYGIVSLSKADKKNQISFTSNPLYAINLKKMLQNGSYAFVPASFSQLQKYGAKDMKTILELKKTWTDKTKYGDYIVNDYFAGVGDSDAFFITELKNPKLKLQDRITCLVQTQNPDIPVKDYFDVFFMQAAPSIANVKKPPYKGSGELSMYGVVKLAKEKGFENVRVVSLNDKFYKHIGFKVTDQITAKKINIFSLASENFDNFLERVSKKYGIK